MIDFSDFSDASGLNLNGDATIVNDVLGLTPAQLQKRGSAFFSEDIAIDADTSFQTQFQFRLREGQRSRGADGFAFILRNSEADSESLGSEGGGLGYNGITQSLAVEFDTYKNSWDENNNHVALLNDGDITHALAQGNPSFDLNKGSSRNAWIDYDGSTNNLQVFVSDNTNKPDTPLLDYTLDLASVLGSRAFVGFSAATGRRSNAQEIQSWKFSSSNPAPSQNISYAITTSNATLTEGNNGTQPLTFTVTRSGATQNASSVSYAIGGSATNDSDYNSIGGTSGATGQTGMIDFAANEASKTITLNVLGDTVVEPDETVQVTLSNGTAPNGTATIATSSATTTITNDDITGIQLST
ncbi:MAG: lectin-like domain-containing protein, partial [Microcystaceae cyanobacterium]